MPLEEALAALLASAPPPPGVESVSLASSPGRILAEDVQASLDVPPADNSAMDGYAVRVADAGRSVPVALTAAAGDPPTRLPPGSAARIFTGAVLPDGAEAVVMQEDCRRSGDVVQLPGQVATGQHIRRRGEDTLAGSPLLGAGRRLRPQDLGLLASQGQAEAPVYRPLRVALLSTGSELLEPGEGALAPGAIFNSNRPMLAALLAALGCEVLDLGNVIDDADATGRALERGQTADLIVSSGGVSVGEADHVRTQVSRLGELALWRIAIKPGKPFAFGRVHGTPFLGLPGNPTSAFVTFLLLARPFIAEMQGRRDAAPSPVPLRADFSLARPGTRTEFLRARRAWREDGIWAMPYENQSSGVLRSVCVSDVLVEVPQGATVARGDLLRALVIDELLR
jgi:molybdopterin molybdotransferase